jgi:hypothetical protein
MSKMKNKLSFIVALGLFLFVIACKKEGQDVWKYENLGQGEVLKFDTPNAIINGNLDYSNLAGSSVSCKVYSYGVLKAAKVAIYASTRNNTDTTTWRKIKEVNLVNDKATLTVSATEMATALGIATSALQPGTQYNLYNQVITEDGRKFSIANTFADYESNVNYNHAFRWTATIVCPFVAPMAGNYEVLQDDWADWGVGDVVQVLDGPGANQLNLRNVYPAPFYGVVVNPMVVNVNAATGAATVPNVTYGNYTAFGNVIASASGSGFVFSCTGTITLRLAHVYGGTPQGTLTLRLRKL